MDKISRTDMQALAQAHAGPAVSIYLPSSRSPQAREADLLLLRNLLTEARGRLATLGLDPGEVDKLLDPADKLLDADGFWEHQSDGLALFVGEATAQSYRLPLSFAPLCVCGPRFHLRPLLPLLSGDGAYFVCAASENEVRLFHGSRDGLDELDTPAPTSEAAANRYEDNERYLGFRSGAPARGGRISAIFYGVGAANDERKKDTEEFARQLAKALDETLAGESAPLVLCGVESLVAMLRHRLNYRHVTEGAVIGNPDEFSVAQIHELSWPLVAPVHERARNSALDEYRALAGSGRTASRLEEVLASAADGRIDSLFIAEEGQVWGGFDADKRFVSIGDRETPGTVELIDLCAALTLTHGGDVFVLAAQEMPGPEPTAALLRY